MKLKGIQITLSLLLMGILALCAGCGSEEKKISEGETAQTESQPKAAMVNPVKKATAEDIEKMGITIRLPENDNWIKEPSYSIISGTVAQINFFDAITETEVTLRAGKEKTEPMAGIYYPFDVAREENWSATVGEEKTVVYIRMQYAISDEKTVGVLLSFSYKDFNYTLWAPLPHEEADMSSVAKTAVYVAEHIK